jgi:hypothetical protein
MVNMRDTSVRDHGLGKHGEPDGPPRVAKVLTSKDKIKGVSPICPNCECETLAEIEVNMTKLAIPGVGAEGVGTYLGCPACPWASPILIRIPR